VLFLDGVLDLASSTLYMTASERVVSLLFCFCSAGERDIVVV
jgi:hypothetical protein